VVASGAVPAHAEGLIDLLSQADRAEVVMLFKDHGDATRLSVRTRPGGVDATVLAGRFGGGGHARAAGATIPLPLLAARDAALVMARELAARVDRRT
ncbi:MAG: DHHA1 domain-containing protein, partial [Candidatus Limnocylindrales bacterium]